MSTEPAAAASSGDKRPASPLDADDERAAKQQRTDDRATTHDFFPEENLFVKPVRITQGAWAITVPRQRLWQTQCEYFRALIAPGVDLKPIELKADTFASFFDMRTVFEAILATGDVVVLPTGTTHDRLALLLKHIDYFELPRTSLLYETVWARAIQTATFEELVAMAERTHQDPDVCRQLVIRLMAPSSLCVMPADAKLRAALAPLLMEYTHARGEAWSMGTAPVKSHAPDTRAAKQLDRVKARVRYYYSSYIDREGNRTCSLRCSDACIPNVRDDAHPKPRHNATTGAGYTVDADALLWWIAGDLDMRSEV